MRATTSTGLATSALVSVMMAAKINKALYYLQISSTNFNYLSLSKPHEISKVGKDYPHSIDKERNIRDRHKYF